METNIVSINIIILINSINLVIYLISLVSSLNCNNYLTIDSSNIDLDIITYIYIYSIKKRRLVEVTSFIYLHNNTTKAVE